MAAFLFGLKTRHIPPTILVMNTESEGEPLKIEQAAPEETPPDFAPFFQYLQSPQGHEISKGVLGFFQDIKKMAIEKSVSSSKLDRWLQLVLILSVVGAVCILSAFDKLDPTVGVVLGTLVGYFFGKGK